MMIAQYVRNTLFGAVSVGLALLICSCNYGNNRFFDFCDVFQLGAGVTSQNSKSGMIPPSLGAHVQATEFLNLGMMHFRGLSAELDGRGMFAGPESRTRIGFGPMQRIKLDQDYEKGVDNYFKDHDALWSKRLNSNKYRWNEKPAKELNYDYWAGRMNTGFPIMHRGWQYWEGMSAEVGICEPFVTHLGFMLRLGVNPCEVSDFLLGFFGIDFNGDDLTPEEFAEFCGREQRAGFFESTPPKPSTENE